MKNVSSPALFSLAALFWFGLADMAMADDTVYATTLGEALCNVYVNAKPFASFCEWTAYVAGAALTIQGIHHFRLHSENAQNNPISRAIMLWFGAMCLLSLPSVIGTIVTSIYSTSPSGGSLTCGEAGTVGSGSATPDVMLTNLVTNIKAPMISVISLVAILCGLFMIVRGLMKASKYGFDPRTHSVHSILANIVFGAMLITIGDNLDMMLSSVFGPGTTAAGTTITKGSVLSWGFVAKTGGSDQFGAAISAALNFVQIIGAIAFVRGWLILKKVVEGGGQATMAQGITHILGGVMAINIGMVLRMFDNTLGTGMM